MKTQLTKDVSVVRVTPPALLGYCKAVGASKREERSEFAHEMDIREKDKWRTALFVRYAERLLGSSDKIFADKRLFYTPLPLPLPMWSRSGNIYSSAGERLTLGHIIVWWQDYKCAQVENEKGKRCYIYGIDISRGKFGSPSKPWGVRYIGDDGECYYTETDMSPIKLGNSLYEVCCEYKPYGSYFELEDAIEHLFGEKVYQRL